MFSNLLAFSQKLAALLTGIQLEVLFSRNSGSYNKSGHVITDDTVPTQGALSYYFPNVLKTKQ